MRVRGGLFCISICVLASGCVPPDANTNVRSNITASSSPGASNINHSNTNSKPTDTNADAPINYAQPMPSEKPSAAPASPVADADADIFVVTPLVIPVAGVRRQDLRNTFDDARSEGRSHDALDIMAAQGTPVLAAADGEIAQFHDSERGGITIYQYSLDKKLIYYYAHLQYRAPNLKKGDFVRQGTIIGAVGDTGNSGAGNFHLHFAVWTITDPKRIWEGANINPYPLLMKPQTR